MRSLASPKMEDTIAPFNPLWMKPCRYLSVCHPESWVALCLGFCQCPPGQEGWWAEGAVRRECTGGRRDREKVTRRRNREPLVKCGMETTCTHAVAVVVQGVVTHRGAT